MRASGRRRKGHDEFAPGRRARQAKRARVAGIAAKSGTVALTVPAPESEYVTCAAAPTSPSPHAPRVVRLGANVAALSWDKSLDRHQENLDPEFRLFL